MAEAGAADGVEMLALISGEHDVERILEVESS